MDEQKTIENRAMKRRFYKGKVNRHLFKLMAGVSLLLATTFAVMAIASLFITFGVAHNGPKYRAALISFPLYLELDELYGPVAAVASHPHGAHRPSVWARPLFAPLSRLFDWRSALIPRMQTVRYLGVESAEFNVPFWLLSAIAAIPAVLFWRSQAKYRIGLCESCGYDLRATPNRCPECGKLPPQERISN